MENKAYALKRLANIAGFLYLLLIITGVYSLIFVSSKIIVIGESVSTSQNILSNEFLFRTSIINNIFSNTIWLFLGLALYSLFEQVNKNLSKLMFAMVIVQIPTAFIMSAFNITSLMIFKGEILETFQLSQKLDLAMLFLKINNYGTLSLEMYWGLWLIPFGLLVYKSGFIPRIYGVLLLIAGIAYMVDSSLFILFPDYRDFVNLPILLLVAIGEISITLWLLIKGVKYNKAITESQ